MPASLTLLGAVGGTGGQTFHRGHSPLAPLKTAPGAALSPEAVTVSQLYDYQTFGGGWQSVRMRLSVISPSWQ